MSCPAVAAAMVMNMGGWNTGPAAGKRRIAVVADPDRESSCALEWALYHAVLERDEIILLHVEQPAGAPRRSSSSFSAPAFPSSTLPSFLRRPSSVVLSSVTSRGAAGDGKGGECEFLHAMQAKCEATQPKVKVHIERVGMESKDKAATILTHTKLLSIDLLVIGQRRISTSFLWCMISGSTSSKGIDTAEMLIEKSKCPCVGVQKKGQNAGYLLNTKTRKNFWLLA